MPVTKDVLKKIRRLQLVSTQLANDVLSGAYKSAFKGSGMEFEEVREYQVGDDIRAIDWNVTARLGHPYVKSFKEERSLTVMLVVDVSASSHFGTAHQLKKDLIAEIGALLAFAAIQNGDKIGLILFSDQIEKYIPPKNGLHHVLRIIRELLIFQPLHTGTNLAQALSFLGKVQRKKSICFVISDFLCGDYAHEASLLAKEHDLISICITDPLERDFSSHALMNLADLETGEMQLIAALTKEQREQFRLSAEERIRGHKQLMHKMGADFLEIRMDQPCMPILRNFFKIRRRWR